MSSSLSAADFTWNGGAPVLNNWSAQANWVQAGAPPLSDTTTALSFSGGTRTAPNAQDPYTINSILFSGTSAVFSLNGNAITFGGFSPFLRNSSPNSHVINNPTNWSNGGTIRAQTSNLTFTGQISLLGGSLSFQPDTTRTIQTGVIAGPGSMTKLGGGILQNNGSVLLGGTVSVGAGTLRLGNTFLAGPYDSFTGSNLELNGNNATFTQLSGNGNINLTGGTLTINQSTNSSTSSPITGAGNLTKTGTGILTLSGSLTHSGDTTINGGTLRPNGFLTLSSLSTHNIGASGTLSRFKTITLTGAGPSDGGAIRFETTSGTGNAFIESNLSLAGDTSITHASTEGTLNLGRSDLPGTLNIGSHALTLNGNGGGDINIRHALEGSGTFIHNRAQNLFLQGSSPAFTGPIQMLGGSLQVTASNSLGATSATAPITLANGATFDLENNITLSTGRHMQLNNGTKLVSRSQATWTGNGNIVIAGIASDTDLETTSASNSLTISGNGLITGVNATLDVNTAADSTITINRDINLTGITPTQTGLRKIGGGVLVLNGEANYMGMTRVAGGTLRLNAFRGKVLKSFILYM